MKSPSITDKDFQLHKLHSKDYQQSGVLPLRMIRNKNPLKYTQLVNFQCDYYICEVAGDPEGIKILIEAGFDYVTDIEDKKLFRKRK